MIRMSQHKQAGSEEQANITPEKHVKPDILAV
jgi:hypothetical protein